MSNFLTTRWTLIVAAADPRDSYSRAALEELCSIYWYPIYAFVRGHCYGVGEAEDLTQSYFALLIEKSYLKPLSPAAGRFRSFLRVSLRNFLSNERNRVHAKKRAPTSRVRSLDSEEAEARYLVDSATSLDPEVAFEQRYALALLERTLSKLEGRYRDLGKEDRFLKLRPFLTNDGAARPQREVAAELEISEVAVKGAVYRLNQQFASLLRSEVAEIVADPRDIDGELRHLLNVLREVKP